MDKPLSTILMIIGFLCMVALTYSSLWPKTKISYAWIYPYCVLTLLPASYKMKAYRSRRPSIEKIQASGKTLHEAYGLLNGKRDSRFPILTLEQVEEARIRFRNGEPGTHIAAQMGVSHNTIMRRIRPKRKNYMVRS
jgi:hypothetical protein